jgi:hypothetical protein
MTIDPATGWALVKTVAEVTKKLFDVAKTLKDREAKQKVDEVLDSLRELKQQASILEDENRDLREKLQFRADEFEFKNPFWYRRAKPTSRYARNASGRRKLGRWASPTEQPVCIVAVLCATTRFK